MSDEPQVKSEVDNKPKSEKKNQRKSETQGNAFINKLLELRTEFRKIVWPSKEVLLKHTVTVVVVSLLFGAYIALTDGLFGIVFTNFVRLIS